MIRLRAGEWLALAGGGALVVSLLLPWYAARARVATVTGFEAFSVIDVLLVLLALLTLALAVLQATQDSPTKPVGAAVVTVVSGIVGALLVLVRIVDQPGPNEFIDVRAGAWIGLAATVAIVAGAWWAMADEHVRGLPPGPEPELRPTPAA
jgi:uncharacterized membrane protein